MKVRDLATLPVHGLRPDDDTFHARRTMIRQGVSHLPVAGDDGRFRGMVHLEDLVFHADHQGLPPRRPLPPPALRPPPSMPVRDLPLGPGPTLGPSMDAQEAVRAMVERGTCAVPVVEGHEVQGIVTATDVLRELGSALAGKGQVKASMRKGLPALPRHAAVGALLRTMREQDVREVLITEGQAVVMDRPHREDPAREDLQARGQRDDRHGPAAAAEWGLVGRVNLDAIASGAWFDQHRAPYTGPKRLRETRKAEPAGRKGLRHVELADAVAEDTMHHGVHLLRPDDGLATAANMMVHLGASGMPVLDDGQEPGYLDRRSLLKALLEAMGQPGA